jgi:Ca-activated chloride channel family protein
MEPHYLWLFLILPFLVFAIYWVRTKSQGVFKFSRRYKDLKSIKFSQAKTLIHLSYLSFFLFLVMLVFALAKPMNNDLIDDEEEFSEGIDIVISLDVSGSMLATDFKPNRLEAAKEVAKDFVDGRKNDRIGLVVYEGEAYTASPATRNHDFLKEAIDNVVSGKLEPGTAIGLGLGTAVARLRADTLKSKVIILLSDGESNKGDISPLDAAKLAKTKNIRVYTIGVGQEGYAPTPVNTPFGPIMQQARVNIDEDLLTEMAEMTGGAYFRAKDKESLREIYKTIDKMEKTKMIETNYQKEPPYHPGSFLFYAAIFLSITILLNTFLPLTNE